MSHLLGTAVVDSLGQGFRPYIMNSIAAVSGDANPEKKLQVPGLLNYLSTRSPSQKAQVDLNVGNGQRRTVSIRQKQRLAEGHIQTGDIDCTTTNVIQPFETPVEVDTQRWFAVYRDDATMQKFLDDAIAMQTVGTPPSQVMNELVDDITLGANQLLQEIDIALMAKVTPAFGTNRVTGLNTAQAVNFGKDVTTNPLNNGPTKLMTDWVKNQANGRPSIIGSGNFLAWMMQQPAKGLDQLGIDSRVQAAQFDFFLDQNASTQWGENEVAMVENGSMQMVEFFENTGAFAGERPGKSTFMTITLPLIRNGQVVPMRFDAQLRYEDCATQFTDGYYGNTVTLQRGWNFIVSKIVGLYTLSDASYRATDVLNGNTGLYRYDITNNCDVCI